MAPTRWLLFNIIGGLFLPLAFVTMRVLQAEQQFSFEQYTSDGNLMYYAIAVWVSMIWITNRRAANYLSHHDTWGLATTVGVIGIFVVLASYIYADPSDGIRSVQVFGSVIALIYTLAAAYLIVRDEIARMDRDAATAEREAAKVSTDREETEERETERALEQYNRLKR